MTREDGDIILLRMGDDGFDARQVDGVGGDAFVGAGEGTVRGKTDAYGRNWGTGSVAIEADVGGVADLATEVEWAAWEPTIALATRRLLSPRLALSSVYTRGGSRSDINPRRLRPPENSFAGRRVCCGMIQNSVYGFGRGRRVRKLIVSARNGFPTGLTAW